MVKTTGLAALILIGMVRYPRVDKANAGGWVQASEREVTELDLARVVVMERRERQAAGLSL